MTKAEINDIKAEKLRKVNKITNWFFQSNKSDNPLAILIKKRKTNQYQE